MKKRFVASFMSVFILFSIITPFSVFASEKTNNTQLKKSVQSKDELKRNGNSVKKVMASVMYGDFEYDKDSSCIVKYNGNDTNVTIPSMIEGQSITKIGMDAFSNNKKIRKVKLPDTIKNIEPYAFKNCTMLSDINFPSGLLMIDCGAFDSCSSLTSITLPDTIENINYAFLNCYSLVSVKLPVKVSNKFNMDSAFYGCSSLKSVNIPEGTTSLYSTFSDCKRLKNLKIPSTVTDLSQAFSGCESLTSMTIPSSVTDTKIAFNGCKKLSNVYIEKGVQFIDENCFNGTYALKNINIPDSVILIGKNAFSYSGLTSVNIPNSVERIGYQAFADCYYLNSVTIPSSVEYIDEEAFLSCSKLTGVNIKNQVVSDTSNTKSVKSTKVKGLPMISKKMFGACGNLKNIKIPSSVKSINASAFSSCRNLQSIEIPASVTSISSNAFYKCPNVVICGKKGSYAQAFAKNNKIPFVTVKITKVKTNKTSLKLGIGSTYMLKTSVSPSNASYKSVSYDSSVIYVASVSSKGTIKAKDIGKAYIYARAKDGSGKYARVTVTVVPKKVSKLKLKSRKKKATINISKTFGARKFEIYRSTKKNKGFKKIKTTSSRKYVNKKLKSKKTYYYKVRAVNGKYKGSFSKVYKVKVK